MNFKLFPSVMLAIPLLGCGNSITPEEKLKMLESQRNVLTREFMADQHRQRAECQAQAIEFSGDPLQKEVTSSCMDTVRFMAETSRGTIERIDKQIAEIRREQQKENPFNQFDGK